MIICGSETPKTSTRFETARATALMDGIEELSLSGVTSYTISNPPCKSNPSVMSSRTDGPNVTTSNTIANKVVKNNVNLNFFTFIRCLQVNHHNL